MRDDKFLDDYFNAEIKPTLVEQELQTVNSVQGPSIEATQQILNKYVTPKENNRGINYSPEEMQAMSSKLAKFKDAAQTVGTAIFTAPAELAQGAARLVGATDVADSIKGGIDKVRQFQKDNTPGSKFQLSPEAEDTAYGIGQTVTAIPFTGMSIPANAVGGAAIGLMQTQEGDGNKEALRNAAIGGTVGGVVTGAFKGVGKLAGAIDKGTEGLPFVGEGYKLLKEGVSNKLGLAGTSADDLAKINQVLKKDINATYKEIGVSTKGMTPEQRLAHGKFISNFADDYNTQVSEKYASALSQKAPDSIAAFIQSKVPTKTDAAVRKILQESDNSLDVTALQNPESLLYYQQYQKALKSPKIEDTGLAKDIIKEMRKVSPEFSEATDMYKTHKVLAKNINSNFYSAVQNDKTLIPSAVELIQQGGNGEEAIRQLFTNGFREQLVKNSNKPALLQLSDSLGSNPLQQQNTIEFLRTTGLTNVADKYQGLVSLVNTAKAAANTKSANTKYLGAAVSEIDPNVFQEGVATLLNSSSKWSDEFSTIMNQKQDALVRSEKLLNLIKRAGSVAKTATAAKTARNVVSVENADMQSRTGAFINNYNPEDNE